MNEPTDRLEKGEKKQSSQRKRLIMLSLLMKSPFVFGICLFLMNSNYIGKMIFSCSSRGVDPDVCSQPLGWGMLGMSLMLIITADLILLGVNRLFPDKPGVLLGTGLVCLFLIWFPVTFIILLGPAILVIMEVPTLGQ
jgi:hypothetical protein